MGAGIWLALIITGAPLLGYGQGGFDFIRIGQGGEGAADTGLNHGRCRILQ